MWMGHAPNQHIYNTVPQRSASSMSDRWSNPLPSPLISQTSDTILATMLVGLKNSTISDASLMCVITVYQNYTTVVYTLKLHWFSVFCRKAHNSQNNAYNQQLIFCAVYLAKRSFQPTNHILCAQPKIARAMREQYPRRLHSYRFIVYRKDTASAGGCRLSQASAEQPGS